MSDMFSDALEFCDGLDVCDRQNLMRELDVSHEEEETTSAALATELTFMLDREKRRQSFDFGRGYNEIVIDFRRGFSLLSPPDKGGGV